MSPYARFGTQSFDLHRQTTMTVIDIDGITLDAAPTSGVIRIYRRSFAGPASSIRQTLVILIQAFHRPRPPREPEQ